MKTVNGVITTSSTMLSNSWPFAASCRFAGRHVRPEHEDDERQGDAVAITVSERDPPAVTARSDHIDVSVHVADRLHRAAEAVDEAGGAGHEALPAVMALLPVRNVNVTVSCASSSEHGAKSHCFLASSSTPWSGTITPELRDRERV